MISYIEIGKILNEYGLHIRCNDDKTTAYVRRLVENAN